MMTRRWGGLFALGLAALAGGTARRPRSSRCGITPSSRPRAMPASSSWSATALPKSRGSKLRSRCSSRAIRSRSRRSSPAMSTAMDGTFAGTVSAAEKEHRGQAARLPLAGPAARHLRAQRDQPARGSARQDHRHLDALFAARRARPGTVGEVQYPGERGHLRQSRQRSRSLQIAGRRHRRRHHRIGRIRADRRQGRHQAAHSRPRGAAELYEALRIFDGKDARHPARRARGLRCASSRPR